MQRMPSKHIGLILAKKQNYERYKSIIDRALLNGYHDFKFDSVPGYPEFGDCICPKSQLVDDLSGFPELAELRQQVIDGVFDDCADKEDDLMTRNMLLNELADDFIFTMLGYEPPTLQERQDHFMKSRQN